VLLGSKPFIKEAKRWRKMLGGGMRQAGIWRRVACTRWSTTSRLAEDHDNAAYFAANWRR
jgi:threonine aldolase